MNIRRSYQVACPACSASVGRPCIAKQGETLNGVHFQRSVALRKEISTAIHILYAPTRRAYNVTQSNSEAFL